MRYDAFLSYSHAADRFRATAVQRALQALAKPFLRWKALNVFRDETSLAANPSLWPAIERALGESRYFVLLAGPESAASAWCAKELAWWLTHRSPQSLLIVLTGGELAYDARAGDFDWSRTTALPSVLKARFEAEPLYVDLRWAATEAQVSLNEPRFRAEMLTLAAALHDKEPQELESEDLRQFRRARLFWRSAAAGLTLLAGTSLVAAWLAERNSREAQRERAVAVARQLAAEAELARVSRPELLPRSVLLAVEAARRMQTHGVASAQVDRSLREGLALLPRAPSILPHHEVVAIALGADSGRALSVSLDGTAGLWDLAQQREIARLATGQKASHAAASPDLTHIVLAVEKEAVVWHVLERRIVTRVTHRSTVTELAFNRDGSLLAVGSLDAYASVIGLPEGREIARLQHDDPIEDLAFSADSRLLATGTGSFATRMLKRPPKDEAAHVWDLASGRRIAHLPHEHIVQVVAFSPDARRLVTGGMEGIARVWDIATQRELSRAIHPDVVRRARFSPDGRYVASASQPFLIASKDQTVQIWEADSGREVGRVVHQDSVQALAFSPDGRWLASGSADRSVRLHTVNGIEMVRLALNSTPWSLEFTADGRTLVVAGPKLLLLPAERGFAPFRLSFAGHIAHIAMSPSGERMALVHNQDTTAVWEPGAAKPLYTVEHKGPTFAAAFSPDGRWFATATFDRSAALWHAASGAEHARMTHDDSVQALAFSPDSRTLATASGDKTARLWDVAHGTERLRLSHSARVKVVRFSSDGRLLASGMEDGTVQVWDAGSGKALMRGALGTAVQRLVFSPDGRTLVAAGYAPLAKAWDPRSGKETARLAHPAEVAAVSYAPNGRLVTATWNGAVLLWNQDLLETEQAIQHEGWINAIAFSRDGRYLATASADRTARVWRFPGMQEVARLSHPVAVSALAFSADDRFLITASSDQMTPPHALSLWPWQLETLIDEACARLGRNLSLEEWRQHLPEEPYRRTCPARPIHLSVLVPVFERAKAAAGAGRTSEAKVLYAQLARDAGDADDASAANQLCWMGALDGAAHAVLPVCNRAVTLAPEDGAVRDSRGVARALLGDRTGAIEDFSAFMAWARKAVPDSPLIAKREVWIAALRAGRDPFDAATRQALRQGE